MKLMVFRTMFIVWLLLVPQLSPAENLLMVRVQMPFEYAMDEVQTLLQEYEYTVAHTQRCDGGLTDFGYKTDYYRVVFFGKIHEVRELSEQYPEIVPFLPLKLLLFAENKETILVALNPDTLSGYFHDPDLKIQLQRWRNDIVSIFNEMRNKKHLLPEVKPEEENT